LHVTSGMLVLVTLRPLPDDTSGGGPALFRLVRFWSRRWANRVAGTVTGDLGHVQDVLVVEAVTTAAQTGAEVTVGDIAHLVGVDRSVASRMATDAVAHGYIVRASSATDARRASLSLTEAGHDLLAGSRAWQQQVFDALTADWSPDDRRRLATYLQRLADDLHINDQDL
jgi:DNA-binding MarR family transcriptional regulator